jgi:hypothetical protein
MAFMKYQFANVEAQIVNVFAGLLTFYLLATAWWVAKRKEGETGSFDWGDLLVISALAACFATFGVEAAKSPTGLKDGDPSVLYFIFAFVALLSTTGVIGVLLRGGISGAQRITRHFWRMSLAMFIATASFFLGQQRVMPASIRGSKLLFVPPLFVLILPFYWLIRVQFTKLYRKPLPHLQPKQFAQRPRAMVFRKLAIPIDLRGIK